MNCWKKEQRKKRWLVEKHQKSWNNYCFFVGECRQPLTRCATLVACKEGRRQFVTSRVFIICMIAGYGQNTLMELICYANVSPSIAMTIISQFIATMYAIRKMRYNFSITCYSFCLFFFPSVVFTPWFDFQILVFIRHVYAVAYYTFLKCTMYIVRRVRMAQSSWFMNILCLPCLRNEMFCAPICAQNGTRIHSSSEQKKNLV